MELTPLPRYNLNSTQFKNPYTRDWPNKGKGTGGVKVPRKPKGPRHPMPARAVAVKHEVKGY